MRYCTTIFDGDFVIARAVDMANEHIAGYLTSVMQHYELMSDHFKQAKGYEAYGNAVDLLRDIGLDKMCEMYLDVQAWGTPDEVVENTGFDFDRPQSVPETAAPSSETLKLMREVVAPQLAEVYPEFTAQVFGIGRAAFAR